MGIDDARFSSRTDARLRAMGQHGYRGVNGIRREIEEKYRQETSMGQREFENLRNTLEQTTLPVRPAYRQADGVKNLNFSNSTEGVDTPPIPPSGESDFQVAIEDGFGAYISIVNVETFGQQADSDLRVDLLIDNQPIFGLINLRSNSFVPNIENNVNIFVDQSRTFTVKVRNTSTISSHDAKVIVVGKKVVSGHED